MFTLDEMSFLRTQLMSDVKVISLRMISAPHLPDELRN